MSWSLNEVEATARKAAKGAGMSWGLAEDAGRAVVWLEARGLSGAEALAAYLEGGLKDAPQEHSDVWKAPAGLCPIVSGAYLADCGDISAQLRAECVASPLLALPFVAWASAAVDAPLTMSWEGGSAEFEPDGSTRLLGAIPKDKSDLTLFRGVSGAGGCLMAQTRSQAHCEAIVALNAFAARTYAPATEASRLSGAGAGTSDND